jgi:chaperonin GroEL (HSP60 family)
VTLGPRGRNVALDNSFQNMGTIAVYDPGGS